MQKVMVCVECGKERIIKFFRRDRIYSKFCSSCGKKGERNGNWKGDITRTKHRKINGIYIKKISFSKKCPECNVEFSPSRPYQLFCCEKHAGAYRQRVNCRKYKHMRRALEQKCAGSFTMKEFFNLASLMQNHCPACGKFVEINSFTVDHIVPLSRGGNNDISNIQPLCIDCNRHKQTKTVNYLIQPDSSILAGIKGG